MVNYKASPTIRNCVFTNHVGELGGSILIGNDYYGPFQEKLNMKIINCNFYSNYADWEGGAIYNDSNCKLEIFNCKFISNSCGDNSFGGALLTSENTKIINCLFNRNKSYSGGAILVRSDKTNKGTHIINCTIVNNTAYLGSGISLFGSWNTTLINTVLKNNGTDIQKYYNSDIPSINNCAISSELDFEYTGENNILLSTNNAGDSNSPYFSDPDNGNYMIQAASSLRDAGIWTDDVPLYDLYGFERDSLPDIGCFEYDESSIDDSGQWTVESCQLYQNYPNPFNPSTNITFTLPKRENVKLLLYNVAGQLVKTLLNEELGAGKHNVLLNASDLNSGMYYYTLKTANTKISKKMLLIK